MCLQVAVLLALQMAAGYVLLCWGHVCHKQGALAARSISCNSWCSSSGALPCPCGTDMWPGPLFGGTTQPTSPSWCNSQVSAPCRCTHSMSHSMRITPAGAAAFSRGGRALTLLVRAPLPGAALQNGARGGNAVEPSILRFVMCLGAPAPCCSWAWGACCAGSWVYGCCPVQVHGGGSTPRCAPVPFCGLAGCTHSSKRQYSSMHPAAAWLRRVGCRPRNATPGKGAQ
jgi:hypothetical protein